MEARLQKIINPADASFIVKAEEIGNPSNCAWHYHPEFELILVLQSEITGFIGDHIDVLEQGDIVLIGETLPHALQQDKTRCINHTAGCVAIRFGRNFLGAEIWDKTEFMPVLDMLNKAKRGIKFYGDIRRRAGLIINKMTAQKGIKNVISLLALLEELAGAHDYTYISSRGFTDRYNEQDEKIHKVYEFTVNNFREDISLPKIASLVYLSTSAFCRYFKSKTAKTYSEFLMEIRIGYACKLLLQEKMNISQICYECGYKNLSNFNRQFKEVTKTTPSDYHRHFYNAVFTQEYAA